jgi:hypothetical protein
MRSIKRGEKHGQKVSKASETKRIIARERYRWRKIVSENIQGERERCVHRDR